MGLRCSLLGHDYGDTFVERDREERGNEVVVTERELAECVRCGAEKVTAENTEVRSLQTGRDAEPGSGPGAPSGQQTGPSTTASDQPPGRESTEPSPGQSRSGDARAGAGAEAGSGTDAGTGAGSGASVGADSGSDAGGSNAFASTADAIEHAESGSTDDTAAPDDGVAADADSEDAVIIDGDSADEPGSEQWDEPAEPAEPDADPEPTPEPEGDDVEFIGGDDADSPDKSVAAGGTQPQSGEQPAQSGNAGQTDPRSGQSAGTAEPSTGPSAQSQGQSETAGSQGGGSTTAGTEADRDRGEWPDAESVQEDGFDAGPAATEGAEAADSTFEFEESDEMLEADTGFTSVGPLDNAERTEADDLDYALYCPECGFERYAGGSSLRAGDICPECRKGYLAEDR